MQRDIRLPGWKSSEGKAEYVAAYEAALSLWPVPHESVEVPIRYGPTHVLVRGPEGAPPLVLLRGAS